MESSSLAPDRAPAGFSNPSSSVNEDGAALSPLAPRSYTILKEVGDGSFGTVWLADWHSPLKLPPGTRPPGPSSRPEYKGKTLVAIKRMKNAFQGGWDECLQLKELRSLRQITMHPNIIPLYDSFLHPDTQQLYFVFECMEGNLYQLTKFRKGRPLAAGLLASILSQILLGLHHIHQNGYFHRDMKPENLLITTTGLADYPSSVLFAAPGTLPSDRDVEVIVKLADFGLAREISSAPPYTEYVSTRWYRAPEVLLRSRDYSSPVDMWALGSIIVETVTLNPLFPGESEVDQVFRICTLLGDPSPDYGADYRGRVRGGGAWDEGCKLAASLHFTFPRFPPKDLIGLFDQATVPLELIDMVADLLRFDPKARLTAQQCLEHPYFTEVAPRFAAYKAQLPPTPISSAGTGSVGHARLGAQFIQIQNRALSPQYSMNSSVSGGRLATTSTDRSAYADSDQVAHATPSLYYDHRVVSGIGMPYDATSVRSSFSSALMAHQGSQTGHGDLRASDATAADAAPDEFRAPEPKSRWGPKFVLGKAVGGPKSAKKEAEKAAREAEKLKREALVQASRERARAVLKKKNNMREGADPLNVHPSSLKAIPADKGKGREQIDNSTTAIRGNVNMVVDSAGVFVREGEWAGGAQSAQSQYPHVGAQAPRMYSPQLTQRARQPQQPQSPTSLHSVQSYAPAARHAYAQANARTYSPQHVHQMQQLPRQMTAQLQAADVARKMPLIEEQTSNLALSSAGHSTHVSDEFAAGYAASGEPLANAHAPPTPRRSEDGAFRPIARLRHDTPSEDQYYQQMQQQQQRALSQYARPYSTASQMTSNSYDATTNHAPAHAPAAAHPKPSSSSARVVSSRGSARHQHPLQQFPYPPAISVRQTQRQLSQQHLHAQGHVPGAVNSGQAAANGGATHAAAPNGASPRPSIGRNNSAQNHPYGAGPTYTPTQTHLFRPQGTALSVASQATSASDPQVHSQWDTPDVPESEPH